MSNEFISKSLTEEKVHTQPRFYKNKHSHNLKKDSENSMCKKSDKLMTRNPAFISVSWYNSSGENLIVSKALN